MPRPSNILKGTTGQRRVVLVGQHPERVTRGVALSDADDNAPGVSYFEVKDTHKRPDGLWLQLENMEQRQGGWFHIRDCAELRIAGNAERIRTRKGW